MPFRCIPSVVLGVNVFRCLQTISISDDSQPFDERVGYCTSMYSEPATVQDAVWQYLGVAAEVLSIVV